MAEIRDRIKELRRIPARELLPNAKNWRKHPKKQRDALAAVLTEIGYAGALLAREEDGKVILIDGHLRSETTPDMEVPVLILDVTAKEADKILATLDPIAGMAVADMDALAALAGSIEADYADFGDLVDSIAGLGHEKEGEDATQEPPAVPVSQPGDLWLLGANRVLCGDSTNAEDVAVLMDGDMASLCFTSPPYSYQRNYDSEIPEWGALMRGVCVLLPMLADGQVLINLGLVHERGELELYWSEWLEWMRSQEWRRFGMYVWDQGPGLPGDWNGRLAPSFELVFHFNRKAKDPNKIVPCLNAGENTHKRGRGGLRSAEGKVSDWSQGSTGSTQAFRIPDSVIRIMRHKGAIGKGMSHPAPFPVSLVRFMLEAFTDEGQIIYEPFCGSGTALIAAETTGRVCYGIEISPAYVDVIVKRWNEFTGKQATCGGKTIAELEAERLAVPA